MEELELALKTNRRLEEWETLTKTIKTVRHNGKAPSILLGSIKTVEHQNIKAKNHQNSKASKVQDNKSSKQ